MNSNDVIIRPVISEKTSEMMEKNKYVFRVAMNANKLQIGQAIKEMFGIRPVQINVMVVRGKKRRLRYRSGNTAAWKKAIVTLKAGEKIEIFEAH